MKWFGIGAFLFFTVFVLLIVDSAVNYANMMDECMASGKKHYECYVLLNNRPVVVQN